jgi:hypothetical protein
MKPVAILSSTILNIEGIYEAKIVEPNAKMFEGVPSYVGHPNTAALLLDLGVTKPETNLFGGLRVGESFLAVPLLNNPRTEGHTVNQSVSSLRELRCTIVTRIA